ncbi:TsaA-like domain-containing protein [Citrus sinensis]|nr:TsaA-like domain-containing protein [Citrus sinensis]
MSSKTLTLVAFAVAASAISASTAISFYIWGKFKRLEKSLNSTLQKCAAERQGRVRAQQVVSVFALRKALAQPKSENLELTSYPMTPIGVVQSCFSTRNGTPRQPLLVPLARACLVFDASRVPPASLEGLGEYSHCWILYVFHLNTDLEKLWKEPSKSKFKAKVRVPRLKGERIGVFATRSPHRPCPIGLTVAKVEAVQGNTVLLSGVDLVDGTVENKLTIASVSFAEGFFSTLDDCWGTAGKKSLYASTDELQSLIKQVLSWDIRSVSQRNRPHDSLVMIGNGKAFGNPSDVDENQDEETSVCRSDQGPTPSEHVIYHLILEGLDLSYRIDGNGNVIVEKVSISSEFPNGKQNRCDYSMWRDHLT